MEIKLLTYDKNLKWSEVYDINNKIDPSILLDYDSSSESDLIESPVRDNTINEPNFSIDNENILKKINNITNNTSNLVDISSLEILKNQDLIMSYLCKYIIQHNIFDYDFLIKLLEWIFESSNYLSNRINLKKINHNLVGMNSCYIPRSSYKFCSFKDSCQYNYENKNDGCYADHYVHNMVAADIYALIQFIKTYYDNKNLDNNKEIIKCITTVSFVIRHMNDELINICYYCKNRDYEKYHKNRHITSKDNKRTNQKRKKNNNNNVKYKNII